MMRHWATRLLKLALFGLFFYLGFYWVTLSADQALVVRREREELGEHWNTLRPSRLSLHWGWRWEGEDTAPEFMLSFDGRDFGNVAYATHTADLGNHAGNAVLYIRHPQDSSIVYVEYHESGEWDQPPDSRELTLRALDAPIYYRYDDHTGSGDLVLAERWETE